MTPPIIPVSLGAETVCVETSGSVEIPGRSAIEEAASPREIAEKALDTADQITASIRAFCAGVVESFTGLEGAARPTKATVEFGLNVSMEGTVYVVKGTGAASVKVVAEWDFRGRT